MPYIKETVKCGAVIEVRKYYSARYRRQDIEAREEKALATSEAQRKINLKNSETKLRRILNANFKPEDLHISLTYDPRKNPPTCFEDAKKNMQLFFRRLKRRCKKEGIEFKAVYVNGVGARSFHHHLVISKEAGKFVKECWNFGRPFFVMLEDNGDYSGLASYLAKHFEKLIKHGEGKKWHEVGDIIRPIVKKEVVKANKFSEIPSVKAGYYLDETSVEMGINDFSGYPYISYRLIKIKERGRMK